jgi:molecular chaperone DnaK
LDANGILSVSAQDKATGKQQSITITASTQLDDKEVEALVKEAAENAAKDKETKDDAEAKIDAESLVFQVEKFIEEMKDKIDAKDKDELGLMAKELKEMIAKDSSDKEAVKAKTKELSTKLQEKGAAMYQKAAAEAQKETPKADETAKPEAGKEEEPKPEKPAEGEVV